MLRFRRGSVRTARFRLTLLYGALAVVSGAVLLTIAVFLWGQATTGTNAPSTPALQRALSQVSAGGFPDGNTGTVSAAGQGTPANKHIRGLKSKLNQDFQTVTTAQHASDLHQLWLYSGIALAVVALLSLVIGWFVAGRTLRPIRTITSAARDISAANLDERLNLDGPEDELRELGDTFDQLLGRLEQSFDLQRQFVANASHELRTPMATMRAAVDVALGKPTPIPESTGILAERIRSELDHVDDLIDSFLTLARAQSPHPGRNAVVWLDSLVLSALDNQAGSIEESGLRIIEAVDSGARVDGDSLLLARMVENVIENAVRHNEPGGFIRVTTEVIDDSAQLIVENGGLVLDDAAIQELTQPFRRMNGDRTGSDTGFGLGLAIIETVATTHGGQLELRRRPDGGLLTVVTLPLARQRVTVP